MKVLSDTSNIAVLSNVSGTSEFKIKNSAKSFQILSSGLYANKVRAIIRELSCNAVDSHVAAGTTDKDFVVHLPWILEPWFSIRDYGTGLSADEVINIYSTYFESTKTNSDDFIGSLGLGSKSPFSYTDNFTVTAIKDRERCIFSAFINEHGVPSIALMHSESDSDEENGVEIKFAVNNANDYQRFYSEAVDVFKWFKKKPIIISDKPIQPDRISRPELYTENIIPGVHLLANNNNGNGSIAVMGNIAYPIDIPVGTPKISEQMIKMLKCGLIMEFDIGELDIQASREGLSYISVTIESIKNKLTALSNALDSRLDEMIKEKGADKDPWVLANFLVQMQHYSLWTGVIHKYVVDNKVKYIKLPTSSYNNSLDVANVLLDQKNVANRYNIKLNRYCITESSASRVIMSKEEPRLLPHKELGWILEMSRYWRHKPEAPLPTPDSMHKFIVNDVKSMHIIRLRHHFNSVPSEPSDDSVFIMSPEDPEKPMLVDQFLKSFDYTYPVLKISDMPLPEKTAVQKEIKSDVEVLELKSSNYCASCYDRVTWQTSGTLSEKFAEISIPRRYYIPLSGNTPIDRIMDPKLLYYIVNGSLIPGLEKLPIMGVRKAHINEVESNPNWISLPKTIKAAVSNLTDEQLIIALDDNTHSQQELYNFYSIIKNYKTDLNKDSTFLALTSLYAEIDSDAIEAKKDYMVSIKFRDFITELRPKFMEEFTEKKKKSPAISKRQLDLIQSKYPLLNFIDSYKIKTIALAKQPAEDKKAIVDYIKLIDQYKTDEKESN